MLLGLVIEVPLVTGELMICLSVGEEQDRPVPPFKQGVKYTSRLAQLFSKSPCPCRVQVLQGWTPAALSAPRLRVFQRLVLPAWPAEVFPESAGLVLSGGIKHRLNQKACGSSGSGC